MSLIIVESPTKARTFNRILAQINNKDTYVFATMGHIRDLPKKVMAIDFQNNFKPTYEIIAGKKKVTSQLKKLASEHKDIILATDPDREGEAIGYHAAYIIGLISEKWPEIKIKDTKPLKRIVFHEITANAFKEALEKPEQLRLNLIFAQQGRRILDRIVGYELSPLLWKKMGKNWLSAGRVQTIALRLIVEREKEINSFKLESYSQIYAFFIDSVSDSLPLKAKLISKDGISYEQKFTLTLFAGEYQYTKTTIDNNKANLIKNDLQNDKFTVKEIKENIISRYPPPPYTTSLLSQDAFYRFGFSSKMTMRIAQDLYERGMITYHRTDSFNLSTQFVFRAKEYIEKTYGSNYALVKPRGYKTKSKMAQEAHEAIRPTKLDPQAAEKSSDKRITINHRRLYNLIFTRAVATQMKEASIKNYLITILSDKQYEFVTELQQVLFDGFLKLLNPGFIEKNNSVPDVKTGDKLNLKNLESEENKTKPPPRYNEASLIKILEEKGIGRPSTYAPIVSLIQIKNYVEKDNRYFTPTNLGTAISDYLAGAFPNIFNLDFTAKMEEGLDNIAGGKENFLKLLQDFNAPFYNELKLRKKDTQVINVEEEIKENCPKCNSPLVVRYSKFGKFLACSNYPKCKFTKPFLKFVAGKICPDDKGRIVVKFTKSHKKFYGCENYPKCKWSSWKWSDIKNLK